MWQHHNSLKSLALAISGVALLSLGACTTQPVAVEPSPAPEPVMTAPVPAPVVQPQPAPVTAAPEFHTVAKGETLYSIGRLYGVHPRELAGWNNIQNFNSYKVKLGEKLRVSAP